MAFLPFYNQSQEINGAYTLSLTVHEDNRGSFSEIWREQCEFEKVIQQRFVQFNLSHSRQGVLRGMHMQRKNPQGKLISCISGSVLDVIIDLRPKSQTFLNTFAATLEPGSALYAPPGCAHGFLVLSDSATVHYGCTTFYAPEFDGGFRWDSPELSHRFPAGFLPFVSAKDAELPTLQAYLYLIKSDLLDLPTH